MLRASAAAHHHHHRRRQDFPLRPLLTQVDIWGGLGADCYADGFNYMTRAYATSAIPIAIVLVIWCVWGLRRLCTSIGQNERRAKIFSQHVQASLLLSYLVFGVPLSFRLSPCSLA